MWVYLAIGIFLAYVLFKERQALGCPNVPNGEDCDNANGKAVRGSEPKPGDDKETLYKKILLGAKFMDRFVVWRVSIIAGFVSAMLIYFFIYSRVPTEIELSITMFVVAAVGYFLISFYRFHLIAYIEKNIADSIDMLKTMP